MERIRFCQCFFFLLIISFILNSCATVSTTGMLEYDPANKDSKIDGVKFSLLVDRNNTTLNMTNKAKEKYPHVFSDEFTALPLVYKLDCRHEFEPSDPAWALLSGFSLTLIPAAMTEEYDSCSGNLFLSEIDGYIINKKVYYSFEKTEWFPGLVWWIIAPFVHSRQKFEPLEEQTLIEYAFKSVSEVNQDRLKGVYNYRKSRLKKVTVYGETYWVFVGLDQSVKERKEGKGKHDIASAIFFKDYPQILSKPIDSVVIATRENEQWKPLMSIPRKLGLKKLTMVSAKIVNNLPVSIEIIEDVKPKVEYFIHLSNPTDHEEIRWSNNMLIDAKNLTFSEDLRLKDWDSLVKLQIELEKEILKLNENLSRLELSFQQKVVKNEDTKFENELIPLYQQRISIFEALITSLKQALKYK